MRGSLIIVGFFALGVLLGLFFDDLSVISDYSRYVLYALMFVVGVGVGLDKETFKSLKKENIKIVLLPLATIVGTLGAALLIAPFIKGLSVRDVLAVSSGFGYYSLSSIIITEYRGAEIGTIALFANIVREIATILLAPLMVRFFSPLSLVSAAGATSIDTLLPVITRFSGREYIFIAIFHGMAMELAVPILVTIFSS